MKYKNIVFDLDGTLSNSEHSIVSTLKKTFAEMNVSVPPDGILLKFIGPPLKASYKKYCGFDERLAETGLRIYQKHYAIDGRDLNILYDGVPRMLEILKNNGAKLFVATSKEEKAAEYVIQKLGIDQYFTDITGASLDNSVSEKEEVIRLLFSRNKLIPSETVLVGDTVFDVTGAKKAGIDCIAVSYGFNTEEQLFSGGAETVAKDISELTSILCR